jgi:hypothetical protein
MEGCRKLMPNARINPARAGTIQSTPQGEMMKAMLSRARVE